MVKNSAYKIFNTQISSLRDLRKTYVISLRILDSEASELKTKLTSPNPIVLMEIKKKYSEVKYDHSSHRQKTAADRPIQPKVTNRAVRTGASRLPSYSPVGKSSLALVFVELFDLLLLVLLCKLGFLWLACFFSSLRGSLSLVSENSLSNPVVRASRRDFFS